MFHVEHLPGVCHAASGAGVNDGGKVRRSLQGAASPTPRGGCERLPVNARYRASVRGGVKTPPYRYGVHGCFVGNGLDRSGDVCRCCMVKYCCGVGAAYMRPGSVRETGRLWETRGPGMPGPYRAAAKKRTPTQPSRPSILAAGLPLTPSPQTPLLPPLRRSPPFPPYRRC